MSETILHRSDCAVCNAPARQVGDCTCGAISEDLIHRACDIASKYGAGILCSNEIAEALQSERNTRAPASPALGEEELAEMLFQFDAPNATFKVERAFCATHDLAWPPSSIRKYYDRARAILSRASTDKVRELEAALAEARKVIEPFDAADEKDWAHLDNMLGFSAHGKFWRETLAAFRSRLSRHPEQSK